MEKLKRQIEALRFYRNLMLENGDLKGYDTACDKCTKIMAFLGYDDGLIFVSQETLDLFFEKNVIGQFKLVTV